MRQAGSALGRRKVRIEIICTGDEVLTGKIVNTNFSYMTQKLEDVGLSVVWGTTVGDDRATLLSAFHLAAGRADIVIVNGGLGPTVDDLSQEIAAQAAGVELELHEGWLATMEGFFTRRGRTMPPNNRKQAMLPVGSEMVDNPIGTACGFALDIGGARFFFTPGVPRELRRMLEEQIIPRLLARTGAPATIRLKRYHGYGLGESHIDQLLQGVEDLDPTGGVKLGFRAHYPQIETKLTIRGTDAADIAAKLGPVDAVIRERLGNFIICEDDQTLEGVVNAGLAAAGGRLAVVETFTAGHIAMRLAHLPGAEAVFRRGLVARERGQVFEALGLPPHLDIGEYSEAVAAEVASAAREHAGASHALAVLIDLDEGADRMDLGGTIWVAVGREGDTVVRRARILGGREWIRLGAVEMGLDCLRRYLQGLPVIERTDFEKR
jgi:nicotinamide-nucleotide amidase